MKVLIFSVLLLNSMHSTSFILYRLPGSNQLHRSEFTSISSDKLSFGEISVNPWVCDNFGAAMTVCTDSTDKDYYISSLSRLIEALRKDSCKTVICRQICGKFSRFAPEELAVEYFRSFPDSFCFMFYHPLTGFWMGASPELLLEVKTPTEAHTRALAGTKPIADTTPWDSKNIEEHRIVVDDILGRLTGLGYSVSAEAGTTADLAYGTVRHLCTPISIHSDAQLPFEKIVSTLHPTSAVGGYPREKALEYIKEYEATPRNCYGGLITVPTPDGPLAYVILRCVHFDNEKWAIYTGSGITHASDAEDEWRETEAKATPLVNLLSSF